MALNNLAEITFMAKEKWKDRRDGLSIEKGIVPIFENVSFSTWQDKMKLTINTQIILSFNSEVLDCFYPESKSKILKMYRPSHTSSCLFRADKVVSDTLVLVSDSIYMDWTPRDWFIQPLIED